MARQDATVAELANVRIWVHPAIDSADFRLIINVVGDDGKPLATIGSCNHTDKEALHAILHAYRMGQRFTNKGS